MENLGGVGVGVFFPLSALHYHCTIFSFFPRLNVTYEKINRKSVKRIKEKKWWKKNERKKQLNKKRKVYEWKRIEKRQSKEKEEKKRWISGFFFL